jgi:hypothetical protein
MASELRNIDRLLRPIICSSFLFMPGTHYRGD